MWEVTEKETLHTKVFQLWNDVDRKLGKNPFVIAAKQGISVNFYEADSNSVKIPLHYSKFRPDEMTIDIFNTSLVRFWDDMFPGCSPELKYEYACWRELWHYWVHSRFAPLRWILGDNWLDFLEDFLTLPVLKREYLGQYFASLATGVIAFETC